MSVCRARPDVVVPASCAHGHRRGPRIISEAYIVMSGLVQVFGCRHDEAIHALRWPASEKRQGTKSRETGHRRCRGRYRDLAAVCDLSAGGRHAQLRRYGTSIAKWGK